MAKLCITLGVLLALAAGCSATVVEPQAVEPEAAEPETTKPAIAAPPNPTAEPTAEPTSTTAPTATTEPTPVPDRTTRTGSGVLVDDDLRLLHDQRVGLIAHGASAVDGRPLATIIDQHPSVELVALFAPEHGVFGTAPAGTSIDDDVDPTTQVQVFSLYGPNRSPTPEALAGVDVLVYDLQDVGARFYTYISTMGLAMQAAAQANTPFVVLDRPNPLGGTVLQGPVRAPSLVSFVSRYPLPSVYGLTAGEVALLIRDQAMLSGLENLDLTIVEMRNWNRDMTWPATGLDWVPPSPNVPTAATAALYPGTVLFEATNVSEGRGTQTPFHLIGAPWIDSTALAATLQNLALLGVRFEPTAFTPESLPAAPTPRFQGEPLTGVRIEVVEFERVNGVAVGLYLLDAILDQAEALGQSRSSVISSPDLFDLLAGTPQIRTALLADTPVVEIIASFDADHEAFATLAAPVLLYD